MRIRAIAAAAALLALSGCSVATAAPTPPSPDDTFLATVSITSPWSTGSDAELIAVAHQTCASFDDGLTLEGYGLVAAMNGISIDAAGLMAGAAIGAYCPEHTHLITG